MKRTSFTFTQAKLSKWPGKSKELAFPRFCGQMKSSKGGAKVKDDQKMIEEELHAYGEAALIRKISKVIQPIPLDPSSIPYEPLVDITLVNDWKF